MNTSEKKFFKALNSYIESLVDDWDTESFKSVFEANIPRLVRKEKKNDDNKVKKPKSVFMFFSTDKEIRAKVKMENPEAKAKEIASAIGALWRSDKYRNYSDEGKFTDTTTGKTFDYKMSKVKKWFDMAKQDKVRYEDEMKEKGLEIPVPKAKKESTRPKSAYNYFCTEYRPKFREHYKEKYTGKELTKKVGVALKEKWETYKDRDASNPTQKDKAGKFNYTKKATKWLEMATADKERMAKLPKSKGKSKTKSKKSDSDSDSESEEEKETNYEKKSKKHVRRSEEEEDSELEIDDSDEENGFDDEDYYSDYEEDYEVQNYEEHIEGSYIKIQF